MKISAQKKLYLPAFSIVVAILVLLVFISFSTYHNINRDKSRLLAYVHQEGVAILAVFEAGTRILAQNRPFKTSALADLLQATKKIQNVSYIYIVNPQGQIIHFAGPKNKPLPSLKNEDPQIVKYPLSRFYHQGNGNGIYEMTRLLPFSIPNGKPQEAKANQVHEASTNSPFQVVLGIKTATFEEAQRSDFRHAIVMAGIVVALGAGIIFFIVVIQNYYSVDRTLKHTKDYTKLVVENMANGLISIDAEGQIIAYNTLACELLNLEGHALIGRDLRDILDFKTTGIQDTLERQDAVLDREFFHQRPSGKRVNLAASVTPILYEKKRFAGAVILLRDLREIKELQEKIKRTEKLAALGVLAAGVAHEIRNPLGSIKGFAQFLSKVLKDKPQEQEYARIMIKEVDRINRVVNDLLTLARPQTIKLEPTSISELIEHVILLVKDDAKACNISIQNEIDAYDPYLDAPVLDKNQMTQALLNLLLNSIQAIGNEGVIKIGAGSDINHASLHFWIEDNGPGIAEDIRGNVFDPFFTQKKEGIGLGLSIVHKIISEHSGEITLICPVQADGSGCRFTITLPLHISLNQQETQ